MSRTGWAVVAAGALVVAVAVPAAFGWTGWLGWAGLADSGSETEAAGAEAGGSSSPNVSTAPVRRTTLVDTLEISGTLGYPEPVDVSGPVGVVTKVPEVGATRKRGEALFRVDDDPVVLLYGSLPAYRTLSSGSHGRDVQQFERNLDKLGYSGFDVDEDYTWYTAEAVREWQEDLGLEETGEVTADRIAYADGSVRIAEVHHEKGDSVAGEPVVSRDYGEHRVTAELDLAEQDLAEVGTSVEVELPSSTTIRGTVEATETVTTGSDDSGSGGGSAAGSGSGETAIELTISLKRADAAKELDRLDAAPVLVTLKSQQRKDVLAVPVSALLALPGGGYAVEVVETSPSDGSAPANGSGTAAGGSAGAGGAGNSGSSDDPGSGSGSGDSSSGDAYADAGGSRTVEVELGMFADGLVEVSSPDLEPGMRVEVPSP